MPLLNAGNEDEDLEQHPGFCHGHGPKDRPLPSGHFWLVLVENQAVTRGENNLPHAQYTSDPEYFNRF